MPSTEVLNATGQFFELELFEAFAAHKAGDYERANAASRRWLLEPGLSKMHRAGFHLILAHAPGNFLEHAKAAESLYRSVLPERLEDVTSVSDQAILHYFKIAEALRERADMRAAKQEELIWDEEALQQELEAAEGADRTDISEEPESDVEQVEAIDKCSDVETKDDEAGGSSPPIVEAGDTGGRMSPPIAAAGKAGEPTPPATAEAGEAGARMPSPNAEAEEAAVVDEVCRSPVSPDLGPHEPAQAPLSPRTSQH